MKTNLSIFCVLAFILCSQICYAQIKSEFEFDKKNKTLICHITNMEKVELLFIQERNIGNGSYISMEFYDGNDDKVGELSKPFGSKTLTLMKPFEKKIYKYDFNVYLKDYNMKNICYFKINGLLDYGTEDGKTGSIRFNQVFKWE
ncbi:hypothetical protein [Bacteroides sp. 51]|uniref:hypothetical protein n=1 Tax=Bacteroides sp. 51 TaxID=2302938 RepID=UPI0013D27F7E|nr:hypothetical protein [Bacteroides sp. 51]NDV81877.1 hypothetical protein [Bacteroides sp. 51]